VKALPSGRKEGVISARSIKVPTAYFHVEFQILT
jgi:hypothetical protein